MKKSLQIFTILMVFMFAFTNVSLANWSASQTVTVEKHDEFVYIFTTVVNKEVKDWLHITGVLDKHYKAGLDGDLSVTVYFPKSKVIYTTAGVRKGLHNSETPLTPYAQVTLQF